MKSCATLGDGGRETRATLNLEPERKILFLTPTHDPSNIKMNLKEKMCELDWTEMAQVDLYDCC